MEASNAERQVEELLTLQEQWYNEAIHIKTPTLFHRLKRTIGKIKGIIDVKKQLRFEISCGVLCSSSMLDDLILDIEFPLDYPSENICQVKAISKTSGKEYISCTNQIQQYLHSFRGCECVEIILDWIEQNKNTCLIESSEDHNNSSNDNDLEGKIKCFVLRYNHLLSGPEHKKEKAMIDTAKKMKLQGALLWGTPGVIVVVPPSTEDEAKDYGSECRDIGKRPDGVEEVWLPMEGIDDAGLGGLAQQKRGGRLQELDTAALRGVCCGDEELLRLVLGIQ